MEKPFKFRRSREIAGGFVLAAAAILLAGIVLHGQIRGWFQPHEVFEVALPEDGSQGLRAGSEVYVLGNKAGIVQRVELRHTDTGEPLSGYTDVSPDKIMLVAILDIRGGMSVFVGSDSTATLKRDLGGFGSSFFEISRGHEPWESGKRRRLDFDTPPEMQDELTATVREIRESITPAIKSIDAASTQIKELALNLNDKEGGFQKTLVSLNSLIQQIDRGEGALGILLKDEQAKKDLGETLTNVKEASGNLNKSITGLTAAIDKMEEGDGVLGTLFYDDPATKDLSDTLANLSKASTSLNTSLKSIEGGAKQFPVTIDRTDDVVAEIGEAVKILQDALSDIELVAEGLQNHWLVKGSVKDVKEDRDKAEEAQRRAEAAARGETPPEPQEKRRGLFFWRKKD